MQLGKPVIATAAYGIEDYVEDGFTGILINYNEIDECFESFVFPCEVTVFSVAGHDLFDGFQRHQSFVVVA